MYRQVRVAQQTEFAAGRTLAADEFNIPANASGIEVHLERLTSIAAMDGRYPLHDNGLTHVHLLRSLDGKTWEVGGGFSTTGGVFDVEKGDGESFESPVTSGRFPIRKDGYVYRLLVDSPSQQTLNIEVHYIVEDGERQQPDKHNSIGVVDTDHASGTSVSSLTTGTLSQSGSDKGATALVGYYSGSSRSLSSIKWGGSGGTDFTDTSYVTNYTASMRIFGGWANNGVLTSDGTVYAALNNTATYMYLSACSWNTVDQATPMLETYFPISAAQGLDGAVTQTNVYTVAAGNRLHTMGIGWGSYGTGSIAASGADFTQIQAWGSGTLNRAISGYHSPTSGSTLTAGYTYTPSYTYDDPWILTAGISLKEASGGGSTNYDVTLADSVTVTDSLVESKELRRDVVESIAVTDALITESTGGPSLRTLIDQIVVDDALVRDFVFDRTLVEIVDVSDALSSSIVSDVPAILPHVVKMKGTNENVTSTSGAELTEVTISWSELVAAGFSAGDNIAIIGGASISGNTNTNYGRAHIRVGSTFAGATELPGTLYDVEHGSTNNTAGQPYLAIDDYQLATDDNIYIAAWVNTGTGYFKDQYLIVMNRDDLGSGNYKYAESTPSSDASTSYTDGASVTLPAGDWWIIGMTQWLDDSATADILTRFDLGGTAYNEHRNEGEDTANTMNQPLMGYFASVAADTVAKIQYRADTSTTHDCIYTKIMAIRLSAFAAHDGQNTSDDITTTDTNLYTDFASCDLTIDEESPVLALGWPVHTPLSGICSINGRVLRDATLFSTIGNNDCRPNSTDSTCRVGMPIFGYNATQAAGTYTFTYQFQESLDKTNQHVWQQVAVAFTFRLLSSSAGITRTLSDSITVTDSIANPREATRGLLDSTTVTDALVTNRVFDRTLSASISVSDFLLTFIPTQVDRVLADEITTQDAVQKIVEYYRLIAEVVDVDDVLRVVQGTGQEYERALSDAVSITDALSKTTILRRDLTDSLAASDVLKRYDVAPTAIPQFDVAVGYNAVALRGRNGAGGIVYTGNDEDVAGFKYQYRIDGGTATDIASPFQITGLTPGSVIDIELRAVNNFGSGAWSSIQTVRLHESWHRTGAKRYNPSAAVGHASAGYDVTPTSLHSGPLTTGGVDRIIMVFNDLAYCSHQYSAFKHRADYNGDELTKLWWVPANDREESDHDGDGWGASEALYLLNPDTGQNTLVIENEDVKFIQKSLWFTAAAFKLVHQDSPFGAWRLLMDPNGAGLGVYPGINDVPFDPDVEFGLDKQNPYGDANRNDWHMENAVASMDELIIAFNGCYGQSMTSIPNSANQFGEAGTTGANWLSHTSSAQSIGDVIPYDTNLRLFAGCGVGNEDTCRLAAYDPGTVPATMPLFRVHWERGYASYGTIAVVALRPSPNMISTLSVPLAHTGSIDYSLYCECNHGELLFAVVLRTDPLPTPQQIADEIDDPGSSDYTGTWQLTSLHTLANGEVSYNGQTFNSSLSGLPLGEYTLCAVYRSWQWNLGSLNTANFDVDQSVFSRTLSDAVDVTDSSTSRAASMYRATQDSIDAADELLGSTLRERVLPSAVAVVDALITSGLYTRQLEDAISIDDQVLLVVSGVIEKMLLESVDVTDNLVLEVLRSVTLSDSVSVTDTILREAEIVRGLSDAVDIVDALSRSGLYDRRITDEVSVTDVLASALSGIIQRLLQESIEVSDELVSMSRFDRRLLEQAAVGDLVQAATEFYRASQDTVAIVGDTVSKRLEYTRGLEDAVSEVIDTVVKQQRAVRVLTDEVVPTDVLISAASVVLGAVVYGVRFAVADKEQTRLSVGDAPAQPTLTIGDD